MSEKNRKKLGFISHPKIQLKYAILNSLFVSGVILLANLVVVYRLRDFANNQSEIDLDMGMLYKMTDFTMQLGITSFVISFAVTFFSTLVITHRFVGPFVTINRYIDDLINKKFDEPLVLRNSDEMHEVAVKLKTLGEKLKALE